MAVQLIRTADIAGKDETSFNNFVGDLVWCEMVRCGIPAAHLVRTEKTKAPDEGLDLRVLQGPKEEGWLPEGASAWQFKSGKCPSARELAGTSNSKSTKVKTKRPPKTRSPRFAKTAEFRKPGVVQAVKDGLAYVFVSAEDLGQKERALKAEFKKIHGKAARIYVYGASHLARWASALPGVAATHFSGVHWLSSCLSFDKWNALPSSNTPFHTDTARTELIRQIQDGLRRGERLIHIAGRAGDGKTRLALEACRTTDISIRTLYLDDQSNFDSTLTNHAADIGVNAIFVVDECEDTDELTKRAERLPSGCAVLGIGHRPSSVATYGLPPLEKQALAAILRDKVPALSQEESLRIASRCGGSPKLLRFLAESSNTDWGALERSERLQEWLSAAYPLEGGPEQMVMHAVCMFSRIGRTGPHKDELSILASWLGVDRQLACSYLDTLLSKGILSPRGYSLYPTPDILADILANKALQGFGCERVLQLLTSLPQRARESFAERLQQVGSNEHTRDLEAILFGPKGWFRDARVLADGNLASVTRIAASAFPLSAICNYEALLEERSESDLLAIAGRPRRELIWALERLAWLPECFASAARLLKRLAIAENETIANNATGCFVALFHPVLGATSAPYELRLPVLEELLPEGPRHRTLLSKAVQNGIRFQFVVRHGEPPTFPGTKIHEWRPPTAEAYRYLIQQLLSMLSVLLRSDQPDVQAAAADALTHESWGLINADLHSEWAETAIVLATSPFGLRQPLLDSVHNLLRFHANRLSSEVRGAVDRVTAALRPIQFIDRMRLHLGRWPDGRGSDAIEIANPQLVELATELVAAQSADDALKWLLSGAAAAGWDFGRVVASLDPNQSILVRLNSIPPDLMADDRFIAGYLDHLASTSGRDLVDDLVDQWAEQPGRLPLAANLTCRLGANSRSVSRLVRLLAEGRLPGTFLSRLTMGFVCRDSSPEELLAIVDASHTDRSEDACRGRLHFLQQYVSQREPTPNLVATLKREAESFVGANWSATDDHIWNEAVGLCFAQGTLGRAEILLRAVAEKAHQRSYLSLEALLASLGGTISEMATDPRRQFFVSHLGPTLAEDPDLVRSLGFGQESGSVLDHFEAGQIVEWISEDIEKRLWPVAHVAAVKAVPMPSLARQLLQRWSARPGVTGALSATFGSGSWVGPRSGYYEHLLGILQEWEKDALVAVRQFARTLRASYEREAKEQKKREEDRDW